MRRLLSSALALSSVLVLLASCQEDVGGSDYATITPRSTELEAASGSIWVSVEAAGNWTISLNFDGSEQWASVEPESGSGSRGDVRLRYDENTSAESRSVTLVLSSGVKAYATVEQKGVGGSSGGSSSGSSSNGTDVATRDWLELPATQAGDGLTVYTHNMEGGKYIDEATSGIRNWTMYWDSAEHLALWVAYPLNNALRGNGSRSNAWGFDPLIPIDQQPNLTGGSYGGGWTRGHQLPSADRLTWKANVSTFYGTNMTPQQYDFNGEIWASLEGTVRGYASLSDTLYVATGCLYEDSTLYTGANSGYSIKVPTHYFKALLFKGTSTYTVSDGYMAAGFLLPHDAAIRADNCLNYIMSVDELESATGIDFFPNLISRIGEDNAAKVEAQAPSKWWK